MPLPSYKEIIELVKVGATIEAQERIMQLRQAALDSQEENIALRNEILELKAKIKELESDAGEPCPRCRKKTWIVESSRPDDHFGDLGAVRRDYKCSACGFTESVMIEPK
jgi:hypothetical protein